MSLTKPLHCNYVFLFSKRRHIIFVDILNLLHPNFVRAVTSTPFYIKTQKLKQIDSKFNLDLYFSFKVKSFLKKNIVRTVNQDFLNIQTYIINRQYLAQLIPSKKIDLDLIPKNKENNITVRFTIVLYLTRLFHFLQVKLENII